LGRSRWNTKTRIAYSIGGCATGVTRWMRFDGNMDVDARWRHTVQPAGCAIAVQACDGGDVI